MAKKLPGALRQISYGQEPEDFEIYGMGSPAGELGIVSPDFVAQVGDRPFEKFGELYAEFIHSHSRNAVDKKAPPAVHLWGVSMGASLAATTADNLIRAKEATQSREPADRSLPRITITMQVPVGRTGNRWQIPLGFVAEFAILKLSGTEYYNKVAAAEKDFTTSIYERLRSRGMELHISDDDLKAKRALVSKSIEQLRAGVPIPDYLRTNEVVGLYDPLMYSPSFHLNAIREAKARGGSLQEHMLPGPTGNRRQFAIRMTHTPMVIRKNYFRRLVRAGASMRGVR
jgi:hypothetical protein